MKTIRFFLLWCMVVAISACTPFPLFGRLFLRQPPFFYT